MRDHLNDSKRESINPCIIKIKMSCFLKEKLEKNDGVGHFPICDGIEVFSIEKKDEKTNIIEVFTHSLLSLPPSTNLLTYLLASPPVVELMK